MASRIELTQSIAYAERSRHKLDVCRPHGAVGAPVVIFFYGGAWQSGYKELYRYVAARLVAAGNAATVLTYRRVGHFVIITAVAPLLRFLVPVMRDVDAFIAATLRAPRRDAPHPIAAELEVASG